MKRKNFSRSESTPEARKGSSAQKPKRLGRMIGLGLCYGFLLANSGCKTSRHSSHESDEPRFTFEFAPEITL